MENSALKSIPYTAISLSVVGRFIFMYLLYKNKSTNSLSLFFCILNICSSSMWIYYSVQTQDVLMIFRSIHRNLSIGYFINLYHSKQNCKQRATNLAIEKIIVVFTIIFTL